ncbi:MAG TPA: serine/threonine-protein kinase [Polyangiaceae bacterium]|nr:serine/threonine-protein kinase [Polyangiaceae bacterium]
MEVFIVFFFLFGVPGIVVLSWLRYRHDRRLKELEVQRLRFAPNTAPLLAQNNDLEQRLRNLESIVCSVDFELNSKLNRLASQQLQKPPASAAELAETAALSLGSIEPGSRVAGRFVVERRLGEGGMGAVYLARDEQLGELVALKMIAGAALLDPAAAGRFRREASAARRISHPNVVRIHDIGEEQGMLFLSMEYISGTSLADIIKRHGTVAPSQLRPWAAQICEGLEAAHRVGVVHRDLKPGNILIDEAQRVKIIDFGLARLPHIEGMTATGLILGTPEYMSPEQIRGRNVDARSDIYSLGAVLYHALVGRPPFSGDSPIAVGFAHCNEALVPPRNARKEVPEAWSALVVRAMAKDPSARFDSAQELAAALPSG